MVVQSHWRNALGTLWQEVAQLEKPTEQTMGWDESSASCLVGGRHSDAEIEKLRHKTAAEGNFPRQVRTRMRNRGKLAVLKHELLRLQPVVN